MILCIATIATLLLITRLVDWCKCFKSTNFVVNKYQGEMKTYTFIKKR